MNKVPCCCNPQSIKTKDKCCSVPCRPAENWRVPARARMLLGAYGAEPEWRRWAPAYRPAARRPSPTRQEPQQEEELPSMGLWWQVLREERELEQEARRARQENAIRMRAALRVLDAREVRRHRLGVAAELHKEMREDGFPEAARTIRQLLLLNDQLIEIVHTYKLRWHVSKLSEDAETLQNVAAGLMAAEMAKRCQPPRVAQQADILYAVVEATLRLGPPYYWLVEQLLLLLVAAVDGYRQDDGFREARARYAYGYVLTDKIGHQSAAQEQLEKARQISAGKLWTLGRVDRQHDKFTEEGELIQESDDGEEEDDTKDGKDKDGDYEDEDNRDDDNEVGKKVVKEIVKEAAVEGGKVIMESGKIVEEVVKEVVMEDRKIVEEIVKEYVKEVVTNGGKKGSKGDDKDEENKGERGVSLYEYRDSEFFKTPDELCKSDRAQSRPTIVSLARARKTLSTSRDSVHLEYVLEQRRKEKEASERVHDDEHESQSHEGGDVIEEPHATLYFCVLEMMCRVLVRLSRAVRRENPLEAVRLISAGLRRLAEPVLADRSSTLLFELGLCYEMLEDYKMALASFLSYVERPKDTVSEEGICSAYLEIAYCYRSQGDKEMATDYLYKALDMSMVTNNHELIGVSHRFLGQGLLLMGRYSEASDRLEESMRLFLDLNMMNDVDRVRIIHGITKGYEVMPYMANLLNDCEDDYGDDDDGSGRAFRALLSWKMHHIPFFDIQEIDTPYIPDADLYRIIPREHEKDPRLPVGSSVLSVAKDHHDTDEQQKSMPFNNMTDIVWERLYKFLPEDNGPEEAETGHKKRLTKKEMWAETKRKEMNEESEEVEVKVQDKKAQKDLEVLDNKSNSTSKAKNWGARNEKRLTFI